MASDPGIAVERRLHALAGLAAPPDRDERHRGAASDAKRRVR